MPSVSSAEYVVIRQRTRSRDRAYASREESGPTLQVEDFTSSNTNNLKKDRSVLGFARNLPLQLVRPVAGDAKAAASCDFLTAIKAHDSPFRGEGVCVAVLDTGINLDHAYFDHLNIETENFSGSADISDSNGHGTHCASVLFGDSPSERVSVAPDVSRALCGKVLDDDGSGSAQALLNGMLWAFQSGANVISMSVGFDVPSHVEGYIEDGLDQASAVSAAISDYVTLLHLYEKTAGLLTLGAPHSQQCLMIAASGNESRRDLNPLYTVGASPLSLATNVLAVGALDLRSSGPPTVASFSNHSVSVTAPGVDIEGAGLNREDLVSLSGTSMATPLVAGAAALWIEMLSERFSNPSAETIRSHLLASASPITFDATDPRADAGNGMVQCPTQ